MVFFRWVLCKPLPLNEQKNKVFFLPLWSRVRVLFTLVVTVTSDILFEPQELLFIFWPKFTGHGILILIRSKKVMLVRDILNIRRECIYT